MAQLLLHRSLRLARLGSQVSDRWEDVRAVIVRVIGQGQREQHFATAIGVVLEDHPSNPRTHRSPPLATLG